MRGDSNAGAMPRKLARPRGGAQPELCGDKVRGAGESLSRHMFAKQTSRGSKAGAAWLRGGVAGFASTQKPVTESLSRH